MWTETPGRRKTLQLKKTANRKSHRFLELHSRTSKFRYLRSSCAWAGHLHQKPLNLHSLLVRLHVSTAQTLSLHRTYAIASHNRIASQHPYTYHIRAPGIPDPIQPAGRGVFFSFQHQILVKTTVNLSGTIPSSFTDRSTILFRDHLVAYRHLHRLLLQAPPTLATSLPAFLSGILSFHPDSQAVAACEHFHLNSAHTHPVFQV